VNAGTRQQRADRFRPVGEQDIDAAVGDRMQHLSWRKEQGQRNQRYARNQCGEIRHDPRDTVVREQSDGTRIQLPPLPRESGDARSEIVIAHRIGGIAQSEAPGIAFCVRAHGIAHETHAAPPTEGASSRDPSSLKIPSFASSDWYPCAISPAITSGACW
jgi:hypothetical protein